MKHDKIIYARVPHELRVALEIERKRMSRVAGADIKTSVVIRTILERGLNKKSRRADATL